MEFNILNPQEIESLPRVQWNFEDLKKYALEKAQEYKGIVYTEDDAKAMKSDRADINRFINAIEDERKKKKKEYMAPYDAFEAQVKEVLKPLREAEAMIAKGLKEIDDKWRDERKGKIKEIYDKTVGDLAEILTFEDTICEDYFKKSVSLKMIEESYTGLFNHVKSDLNEIEHLDEKYQAAALRVYKQGGRDLSVAFAEVRRIQQDEAAMEERKRKAAEQEAKAQAVRQEYMESTKAPESTTQSPAAPAEIREGSQPDDAEPVLQIRFQVYGTREQILSVRDFMVSKNIKFGRIR